MLIRAAGPQDIDLLTDLRLRFVAEVRDLPLAEVRAEIGTATHAFVADRTTDGSLHSWLASAGGDGPPLGAVSLLQYPVPPLPGERRTHDGYVLNMYVAPSARGGGVGRRLLDACLAGAAALDVRRVFLVATEMGRPLYEAAGFTTSARHMELRRAPAC